MKVKLLCSDERKTEITQHLIENDFELASDADFVFYEKDYVTKKYLTGKKVENISLINMNNIIYFEGLNNETFCYTQEGKFIVKEKLYQLEEILYFKDFIRVSKSMLINIEMIEEIIPWIGSKFVLDMKNGHQIDVNRTYYNAFKAKIGL